MKDQAPSSLGLALLARTVAILITVPLFPTGVRADAEVHSAPRNAPTFSELPPSIPLWAGTAPGSEGAFLPEKYEWENFDTTWYAVVTNINSPSIIPFLPDPARATGVAVVVCPGGGHRFLAMEHEGYAVGKWFADHGIAAFVLKYRLSDAPGSRYRVEIESLMDAQRAIRTVRHRATEWRVNPSRIGIIGFSAGGEVAFLAGTQFGSPVRGSNDDVDSLDCRPDFLGLFYPGLPKGELRIGARIPPVFLCGTSDDQFHLTRPMVGLYLKLTEAGVPCEMHVYSHGGHGFGIRDQDKAVYSWMGLFERWISDLGGTGKG